MPNGTLPTYAYDLPWHERPRWAKKARINKTMRIALYERDGAYCRYCGDGPTPPYFDHDWRGRLALYSGGLQIDHIVPMSGGGTDNDPDNIVLCCETCNRKKGTRTDLHWQPPRPPAPICILRKPAYPTDAPAWAGKF